MTHRDPTIIGLCHPRDIHWLNAGLNAETKEDWERVAELREAARALGNLESIPPVINGLDFAASGGSAFQGINREPVTARVGTLGQVLTDAAGLESNSDSSPRARE